MTSKSIQINLGVIWQFTKKLVSGPFHNGFLTKGDNYLQLYPELISQEKSEPVFTEDIHNPDYYTKTKQNRKIALGLIELSV